MRLTQDPIQVHLRSSVGTWFAEQVVIEALREGLFHIQQMAILALTCMPTYPYVVCMYMPVRLVFINVQLEESDCFLEDKYYPILSINNIIGRAIAW